MRRKQSTICALIFFCAAPIFADESKVLYIEPSAADGAPVMPHIKIHAGAIKGQKDANIVFKSSSEHQKRGNKDDITFTINDALTVLPSTLVFDVNEHLQNRIFGGRVNIYAKSGDASLHEISVYIRGKNPTPDQVKAYIEKHCGSHWYAWAIARHESRQSHNIYNQFNAAMYKTLHGIPNHGAPDGWGIMQLDSKRGSQITTDEVYNWHSNVLSGIKLMDSARKEAAAYFNAVKRTFPDKWEEPPAYFVPHGCTTKLSAIDASVIQMYNGAAVVRKLKTPFGSRCYYRSAWAFNENAPAGRRWSFKTNSHDYVYKVVHNEYENKFGK